MRVAKGPTPCGFFWLVIRGEGERLAAVRSNSLILGNDLLRNQSLAGNLHLSKPDLSRVGL